MGWYHHAIMNGEEDTNDDKTTSHAPAGCPDGKCSLLPPDVSAMTGATTPPGQEELYLDSGPIYHLCQKRKWMEAIEGLESYFPPTFWLDGRFTRGCTVRESLVETGNIYYRAVAGEWICLEIDPTRLRSMGIAIAVHRAPESTRAEPAQCLKIYGGLSTNSIGLVREIYAMRRGSDGTFVGMLPDCGTARLANNKAATTSPAVPSNVDGNNNPKVKPGKAKEETARSTKRGGVLKLVGLRK
jgi:hypothetical protein